MLNPLEIKVMALLMFPNPCMPIVFPGNPTQASITTFPYDNTSVKSPNSQNSGSGSKRADDYLIEIGYDPVEEALRKHRKESVGFVFGRGASP